MGGPKQTLSMRIKANKFFQFYIFNATADEIKEKQFNLRYSCAKDIYERYLLVVGKLVLRTTDELVRRKFISVRQLTGQPVNCTEVKKWESCHFISSNIFRKEERDWKMVYLARAEDTETATIAWKFNFTDEQLIMDSVAIKFETKTYENGAVDLQILNEHGE